MLQAAVIGTGRIARQHLQCLAELPGVKVSAVCDLWPGLAEAAADRFGIGKWFTDHRKMLAEIRPDVVHVTTPPASHFRLAMDALEAGAHAIVEKPITPRLEDLSALQAKARETGRMLLEDYNYLFNQPIRRIVGLIESGELGEVTHVEVFWCMDILRGIFTDPNVPHPSLAMPGGAISDFLSHLASLCRLFVGPHESVRTIWAKQEPDSPLPSDELRAIVKARRATAYLGFSARTQPDEFVVRVCGTKMRAETNLFEGTLTTRRHRAGPKALGPIVNGLNEGKDLACGALRSLVRKVSGGPGAYEGIWELLSRTYAALGTGGAAPLEPGFVDDVNRLVSDLTKQELSV